MSGRPLDRVQSGLYMRTYTEESDVVFVEANGLRFGTLQAGEGPLVLLMHGFPDTPHTWDDVRPALAEAGYFAVSPFMRGYAPTTIPEGDPYTNRELGNDVLALIQALGYESAVVVGHDWGASAAYAAAHLNPERVSKLVTVAIPHPRTVKPSLKMLWTVRHFITLKLPGAVKRFSRNDFHQVDVLCKRWSPTWDPSASEFEPIKNALSAPGCANATLGYYRRLKFKPESFMKAKLTMPVLSFAGLDDILDPSFYDAAAWMYEGPYTVEKIPGGHFMHRENPALFADKLLAFLAD